MRKITAITLLFSVACGGSPFIAADTDSGGFDANQDAFLDESRGEVGPQGPEGGSDASADTDLGKDTGRDANPDVGFDAGLDASLDASLDTDSSADTAGPETSSDAGSDTGADTMPVEAAPPPDAAPACFTPLTPVLNNLGAPNSGIQFHVTQDTILQSFTFTASAAVEDVVTLSDDQCNALETASVPARAPNHEYDGFTVQAGWPLKAGVTYRLTNVANQPVFATGETFPWTTGELSVTNGFVSCPNTSNTSTVWIGFSNLVFCP